jgi:outer membrane protein assembly factor BamD (BamD/ComL family)
MDTRSSYIIVISLLCLLGVTSCNFMKKKVPPHEMFAEAEKLRKSGNLVEAAQQYDALFEQHQDSELAPAALYYSGTCKYTLSVRCPGKKEFEQRKATFAELKQKQYKQCIDYMKKHKKAFSYGEAIDKYVYKGTEFEKLIASYPSSNLLDDAAFQFVRTQILEKQQLKTLTVAIALQMYAEFFEKYPQSSYRQKVVEDMVKLISEYSEPLLDHPTIVETYQKFIPFSDDFPELAKLSYSLGKKLIEEGDLENAAPILGVPSVAGIGIVNTQQTRLNIRGGQGTNHKIVGKADKGEELLILDDTGQWYHVQLEDGTMGYAHSDFIRTSQ